MQDKFKPFKKFNQFNQQSVDDNSEKLENLTEDLNETTEECLDKIHNQANKQSQEAGSDADPDRTKTIVKLSLSTLLILMILGVGFLNQKPGQMGADKKNPIENQVATSTLAGLQGPIATIQDKSEPDPQPTTEEKTAQTQGTNRGEKAAAPENNQDEIETIEDEIIRVEAATENLKAKAVMPAKGNWSRLFAYSYDETWQDYRFHQGVDLELALGSKVKPILGGTVLEISDSANKGQVIKISHSKNLTSCYYGLKISSDLNKGSQVDAKTVIGTVAEPPLFESSAKPHLHLELWQDDKAINPLEFLGVNQ